MAESVSSSTRRSVIDTSAYLVVVDGVCAGQRFPVDKHVTIGRSSRSNVPLPSQLVSRTHAEVVLSDQGYIVRDLGSSNGTLVNHKLVSQAALSHGDLLAIGDVTLVFELAGNDQDSTSDGDIVLCQTLFEQRPRIRLKGRTDELQKSIFSDDVVRARRARQRLDALVSITRNLASLRELEVLYPLIVDEVMGVIPAERCVIMRGDAASGLRTLITRNSKHPDKAVEVSRTVVDEVVSHRECVLSSDALLDERIGESESIMVQDIRSVLCVPIENEEEMFGVLYLDAPGKEGAFTEEDLHFVSGIAGVAAVAISNALHLEQARTAGQELNHAYLSMLAVLANAIEARDHYTIGHTWRVARFAQAIARRLDWDATKLKEVEVGGMLHDIGKIGVSDVILSKPGPLTPEEHELMKVHPQVGARMLRDVPSLQHVMPYVLYHHERYDGQGYPDNLVGVQIPQEARLLAVADTFDAMTSNRPYRQGLSLEVAVQELKGSAGQQCDPEMVQALVAAFENDEIQPYMQMGLPEPSSFVCPFCSTYLNPPDNLTENSSIDCPVCSRQLVVETRGDHVQARLA